MSQSSASQPNSASAAAPGIDASMAGRLDYLDAQCQYVEVGGGEAHQAKQHRRGKMTVRECIDSFVDGDMFRETDMFMTHRITDFGMDVVDTPTGGVIAGAAAVLGRTVYVASQDFAVMSGPAGETQSRKVAATMRAVANNDVPFAFINDSGGTQIQEGINSLSGYGQVLCNNVWLSDPVPQVSTVTDPYAGGAIYSPALTDFTTQTRNTQMPIIGPDAIKSIISEEIAPEQLGGADTYMGEAGSIDFVADDDGQTILIVQKLLSFLPQNNAEEPPIVDPAFDAEPDPELHDTVPVDGKKGYDVREVIIHIADNGDFLECQASSATSLVVGLGRILGRIVGFIADQPSVMSDVLDINSSGKGAKFTHSCNAFSIPLVTPVDIPDFMPGVTQEHGGIIRHGVKTLYAYSTASVPKATIVMREVYSGVYLAICSKNLGTDYVFAWLTVETAVMSAEGAINAVFRKEIAVAGDEGEQARACDEYIVEYKTRFSTPYIAALRGPVDDVINPAETRLRMADALSVLCNRYEVRLIKKHGSEP